ncbi:hypothetical protein FLJC2902T_00890 [Flavobacterium limnosediminis JC2902]|uniref:Uncharacterized protein n=1 Tax=Flavobacterium limnosediminis JC2902 TaxID=1341181 RepID=V6SSD9_9FLAO|nr:hypothetical protein FLJC2902T_00890 [Flavobacterium limnosediminis JC2902]
MAEYFYVNVRNIQIFIKKKRCNSVVCEFKKRPAFKSWTFSDIKIKNPEQYSGFLFYRIG